MKSTDRAIPSASRLSDLVGTIVVFMDPEDLLLEIRHVGLDRNIMYPRLEPVVVPLPKASLELDLQDAGRSRKPFE
jgi:hypothetical protein